MAPLVFRTYKASPSVSGFLPLTVERREEITAYLARLKNCEEFETIPMDKLPPEADDCFYRRGLLRQGEYFSYFLVPKYLALNAGDAIRGVRDHLWPELSALGASQALLALARGARLRAQESKLAAVRRPGSCSKYT